MLRSKWLGVMYAAATLTVLAPGTVSAQPADKRTFFTFSGNVEMPGVALPAGKYEFRIANPDSSRNVIQVRSGDGKKTFGLFLTHSSQRVTGIERSRSQIPRSGRRRAAGDQNVVVSGRAYRLRVRVSEAAGPAPRAANAAACADNEERDDDHARHGKQHRLDAHLADRQREPGERQRSQTRNPAGSRQAGQRADSGSVPPPSPAPVGTSARARTQLPRTASATPLVALMGLLMLTAAAVMRQLRRRML